MSASLRFPFDNSYVRLDPKFYARVDPTPVAAPQLIKLNRGLASELGLDLDGLDDAEAAQLFSGNAVPAGAEPLAMAYAGHQFGGFSPQLGDGRAILLGEVVDQQSVRRDIQLKGSGLTAFSRRGDGRSALGPVLREYLVSEAMAVLGIPTTRSLAAVSTGQTVMREMPLPGGVLTRVASSHVRIGTFQYFAAKRDGQGVQQLADYIIDRHYPEARTADRPYLAFLDAVIARQASLVARWMGLGFIHGVMNTDNMSIVGETIDYGPCAFMDEFHPAKVFSSIDQGGRYAWGNQPQIAQWNLARLADCLFPLFDEKEETAIAMAEESLGRFGDYFEQAYGACMRAKLGLMQSQPDDLTLAKDLLGLMAETESDFTQTFRSLYSDGLDPAFAQWHARWAARVAMEGGDPEVCRETMRKANPAIIPRNHQIEAVIKAAVKDNNFAPFHQLHAALGDPCADRPPFAAYEVPPEAHQRVRQTFCGT